MDDTQKAQMIRKAIGCLETLKGAAPYMGENVSRNCEYRYLIEHLEDFLEEEHKGRLVCPCGLCEEYKKVAGE